MWGHSALEFENLDYTALWIIWMRVQNEITESIGLF